MYERAIHPSRVGLESVGLKHQGGAYWNLRAPALVQESLRRGEGHLVEGGAYAVRTGRHTGRSPKDKFVVREGASAEHIWWGKVNAEISAKHFEGLKRKMFDYLSKRDVFVQDLYAGADAQYRLNVRIITEYAWHSLFARQLFIRPEGDATAEHNPDFTVINAPGCKANPAEDGTASETFIALSFEQRLVLIGGTEYAGETKKSIFTVMNYVLPRRGILSMHCSANVGEAGDAALFFGLSGTGKTTLSADPKRRLIGDDEHGWSDTGVFNMEGGCYAKVIRLSPKDEPQIYGAIRFGTVLENVVVDPVTLACRYDDDRITENTRAAYPLNFIANAVEPSVAGHPKNIVFLTCDAFGVLPPIARLTPEQAMYHFLSGYTAKVAGTEAGMGKEPQATFSTCFGAPFLPLDPSVYAELLGRKIAQHKANVWLLNTGWSGGPFGVGKRMKIAYTRAMVNAALDGRLAGAAFKPDPVFRVEVPQSCPEVPAEVLLPRNTWADKGAYDAKAKELATLFKENFAKFEKAGAAVKAAGPA